MGVPAKLGLQLSEEGSIAKTTPISHDKVV